jgi:hypothetical protein
MEIAAYKTDALNYMSKTIIASVFPLIVKVICISSLNNTWMSFSISGIWIYRECNSK